MIKKIIYSLLFMTLISFLIIKNNSIVANASAAKLYLVFDKMTYGTNEIVNLNINLDQFSKLSEMLELEGLKLLEHNKLDIDDNNKEKYNAIYKLICERNRY